MMKKLIVKHEGLMDLNLYFSPSNLVCLVICTWSMELHLQWRIIVSLLLLLCCRLEVESLRQAFVR